MEKLIQDFALQMKQAVEIGEAAKFFKPEHEIRNICLIGMGGSAFGGEIVRNYISASCGVPFEISRDYTIPAYVGKHTLLIVSSYSGNTEETIAALSAAMPRHPKVVAITSGGKIHEIARSNGYDAVIVPGGYPPRTAAGFSIIQQLYILNGLGLIKDFKKHLDEAISVVEKFDAHDDAKLIADQLHRKIPVLYTSPSFESVAIRWRQQIEENAKQLAFHHVVPEMNHNELVGWKNPAELLEDCVAVMLRSKLENPRNSIRLEITRDLIGEFADAVIEVKPEGKSHLAQLFYFLPLSALRGCEAFNYFR